MRNIPDFNELPFNDWHLNPRQWEAFKARAMERAKQERAMVMQSALRRLFVRIWSFTVRAWANAADVLSIHNNPVFPSRGA